MKGNQAVHRRVLEYAYRDTDALARAFHLSDQGYDDDQVEASRAQYGENVLSGRASDTVWYRLRRAFINPFSIVLLVLAILSFFTDVVFGVQFQPQHHHSRSSFCACCCISGAVRFACRSCGPKRIADRLTGMISTDSAWCAEAANG